jgi:hypothetical protein
MSVNMAGAGEDGWGRGGDGWKQVGGDICTARALRTTAARPPAAAAAAAARPAGARGYRERFESRCSSARRANPSSPTAGTPREGAQSRRGSCTCGPSPARWVGRARVRLRGAVAHGRGDGPRPPPPLLAASRRTKLVTVARQGGQNPRERPAWPAGDSGAAAGGAAPMSSPAFRFPPAPPTLDSSICRKTCQRPLLSSTLMRAL